MADKTGISWTDATWSVTTGCDRVSPGCGDESGGGCYAERLALRLQHTAAYAGTATRDGWTGQVNLVPERLDQPRRWKRPRRIFVDSMSDLFHPDVPLDFILKVWSAMSRAPQHRFQVLTKRPQRMAQIVSAIAWNWDGDDKGGEAYAWPGRYTWEDPVTGEVSDWEPDEGDLDGGGEEPLPHVEVGTSIELDRYAFRANYLRATPAALRFVSAEPLLGPLPSLDLTGISWLIIGGESGPRARRMDPEWAYDLIERCDNAGVKVHFKQAGLVLGREWGCADSHGGDDSAYPEWARRREIPA